MMIRSSFLTMIFALLGIAWAPATMAQFGQPAVEQSAASYSDAELQSFAVAVLEVESIKDTYTPKLEAAKNPEEQQQVKQAASLEMVRAVEQQGMSVDRYQEILLNDLTNPELAKRVDQPPFQNRLTVYWSFAIVNIVLSISARAGVDRRLRHFGTTRLRNAWRKGTAVITNWRVGSEPAPPVPARAQ